MSGIGLPTNSLEPIFRSPGSCSEFKGLSDGKMREVAINFLVIKDFALNIENNHSDRTRSVKKRYVTNLIFLVHCLHRNAIVLNLRAFPNL